MDTIALVVKCARDSLFVLRDLTTQNSLQRIIALGAIRGHARDLAKLRQYSPTERQQLLLPCRNRPQQGKVALQNLLYTINQIWQVEVDVAGLDICRGELTYKNLESGPQAKRLLRRKEQSKSFWRQRLQCTLRFRTRQFLPACEHCTQGVAGAAELTDIGRQMRRYWSAECQR